MTFPGHLVTIRVMDELDPFLVQLILAPIFCTTNLRFGNHRRIFIRYIWLGHMQTLVHHNMNSVHQKYTFSSPKYEFGHLILAPIFCTPNLNYIHSDI